MPKSPGALLKQSWALSPEFDATCLGWGLRIYISSKFPSEASATGLGAHVETDSFKLGAEQYRAIEQKIPQTQSLLSHLRPPHTPHLPATTGLLWLPNLSSLFQMSMPLLFFLNAEPYKNKVRINSNSVIQR